MERLRQGLTWVIRVLLFVFILLFAMKNTTPVELQFYFGQSWRAPLALVLFLTLVAGAALGLLAALERIFAQRREIAELRKMVERRANEAPGPVVPRAASAADFDGDGALH